MFRSGISLCGIAACLWSLCDVSLSPYGNLSIPNSTSGSKAIGHVMLGKQKDTNSYGLS